MTHRFVDIGVNLDHRRFDADRDEIVERAAQARVDLILTGTSHAASGRAASLAEHYRQFSTAGVHPHDSRDFRQHGGEDELERLLTHPRVVAVGECGLDFDRDFSPRDDQEQAFRCQLSLAERHKLPLFLHERDAHSRFCGIFDEMAADLRGVVHCFTGTEAELDAYLDRGLYIGITGWICDERRGQSLREVAHRIPAGRLLIETDAPFLTPRTLRPRPKKGRNEPSFLPHIASFVAELRQESVEALAQHTTLAAEALFGLARRRSTLEQGATEPE